MSEYLFIGGFADGLRKRIPDDMYYVQVPAPCFCATKSPDLQAYRKMRLAGNVVVYALDGLGIETVGAKLVERYAKPITDISQTATKLYLVTSRDSRPYCVEGIFSDLEKARVFAKTCGYDLDEDSPLELDGMSNVPCGKNAYRVKMFRDGSVESAYPLYGVNDLREDAFQNGVAIFEMWAEDAAHAVKIAGEKSRKILDANQWRECVDIPLVSDLETSSLKALHSTLTARELAEPDNRDVEAAIAVVQHEIDRRTYEDSTLFDGQICAP